ncbi:MAG: hypothetical protein QOG64_829 [Acidimicrobiaceae bacterium]|jgi:DMSO/TMAO reductase YedYZ molybdopterin-dependent catalytic subunit|nr:hypothetical protein [Acidimicrobiaceae bacterium]
MDVEGKPVGRRVFLGMLAAGGAGILWGGKASEAMSRWIRPVTERDVTGLSDLLPTAGRFRYYSIVGFSPHRSDAEYKLAVNGMVDKPLSLSLPDLQALPSVRLVKDFQCVTGWRVPNVPWTGVRLADVLDAAGVQAGAAALTFTSFDNAYTESLSLDQARRPDVMVAYSMEDKPISSAHGGPVRLYVAPMYGYKSCKWLDGITVVPKVQEGYWEHLGYDVDGWIGKSNGRDDAPVT